jgi:hypothetical protein
LDIDGGSSRGEAGALILLWWLLMAEARILAKEKGERRDARL